MHIELFLDYLRYERGYSAHTVEAYGRDLLQFALYINVYTENKSFDPRLIDSDQIRNWLVSLLGKNVAASSANRKLSALKSYFKYLMKQDVVSKNPLKLVAGPKKKPVMPVFLRDKELSSLLDGDDFEDDFEGMRDRLLLELLYETGIRRSELVGLRQSDVDVDAMQLKVTGKRNKQRLIPFAERLRRMLIAYLEAKQQTVPHDSGRFFVRTTGEPLTPGIVYYIVRKRLSAIPTAVKRSPHVLRHTFATSLLNDGAELNAVKDLLGHGSLASTSVYTHLTFEELKKMYHAHPRAKK
ncbi:MAG: tyrosine-type recombinase/integrase [Tannerella sp.]|jgi:integrase/recombinase XerC|nr:tyrosine-type recombinase/integrase [Tannerella sp.]